VPGSAAPSTAELTTSDAVRSAEHRICDEDANRKHEGEADLGGDVSECGACDDQ
jgi:hypothetical protein